MGLQPFYPEPCRTARVCQWIGKERQEDIAEMGRFATTASLYAARREPYPAAFFAAIAEALELDGHEALIDLGTGPGLLALSFAPYVRRLVGVDPEPAMIAEAREAAASRNIALTLIEGHAETLPADLGPFDLVTIGRALHWMEREATLATLDRILAPDGRILICRSSAVAGEVNAWREAYDSVLHAWSGARGGSRWKATELFFDGTRFARTAEIKVTHSHETTPQALVERALTRSTTSPAVLGQRIGAFRAELLAALAPYFPESVGCEVIEASAWIFR
jgi:ubiquinone/menaquinone biosynthesis C-methylase UbiE